MPDARFEVQHRTFPGRISNADPHDLPPGAMVLQDNIHSRKAGQLDVRDGIQATAMARASGDDIISLFRFDRPDRTYLVWHTSTGKIQAVNLADLSTVLTLGTGYSSYQPVCFAQDRRGVLYGVNGIQNGFRWDGLTAALESLGMDAPGTAPTAAAVGSGGAMSAGDYSMAYRWLDDDQEFDEFATGVGSGYPTSFSPITTTTVVDNDSLNWSGLVAPTNSRVNKVELWRTTADQSRVYYRLQFVGPSASMQTYIKTSGTVSTAADNGGFPQFTTPSGHGLVVNARILMAGNSEGTYNTTLRVTAVTDTTFTVSGAAWATAGGAATWTTTGYYDDDDDDDTVAAYQSMPYSTNDGARDIANRFEPPPGNMPYIAFLQDRMFMAGTVEYTEGTVATNGTSTITGTSTLFATGMIGSSIYIGDSVYKITGVSSTTSITVSPTPSATASGLSFRVIPPLNNYNKIMFSEADEPEAMPVYNEILLQQNQEDSDKITGIAPNNSELIVGQQRHLYAVSFFRQPDIDAQPNLIANRGMLNNRCWVRYDNNLYIMDSAGVHVARGPEVAESIGDLWRDESFSATTKYFFAVANRSRQHIRFHVNFTETGLPKRWLEVRPGTKSWTTGTYATGLGSGCYASGRTYYGTINRRLLVETPGSFLDHVNAGLRGSPTQATSNPHQVVTNSGAAFTDSILDSPVSIVSGTGKGQTRYVTARTGTTFTVDAAFTTALDTTSVYSFGAIPWAMRTGILENGGRASNENNAVEEGLELVFEPNGDSTGAVDIRRYLDHASALATNNYFTQDLADGVTVARGATDAVLDLYRSRYPQEDQAGWWRWIWGNTRDRAMTGNRFVTLDFRGWMHGYQVTIYDLQINSAE